MRHHRLRTEGTNSTAGIIIPTVPDATGLGKGDGVTDANVPSGVGVAGPIVDEGLGDGDGGVGVDSTCAVGDTVGMVAAVASGVIGSGKTKSLAVSIPAGAGAPASQVMKCRRLCNVTLVGSNSNTENSLRFCGSE